MVRTGLQWFLTSTGPAASSHIETGAFVCSRPDVPFPDVQLHFLPSISIDHGQKMADFHAFQASFWLPKSYILKWIFVPSYCICSWYCSHSFGGNLSHVNLKTLSLWQIFWL